MAKDKKPPKSRRPKSSGTGSTASYYGSPTILQSPALRFQPAVKPRAAQNSLHSTRAISALLSPLDLMVQAGEAIDSTEKRKGPILPEQDATKTIQVHQNALQLSGIHVSASLAPIVDIDMTPNSKGNLDGLMSREDWDNLHFLRIKALRHRSTLQRERRALRQRQTAKDRADEAFMRNTRENRLLHSDHILEEKQAVLERRYEELQHTRNEYGPTLVECMQEEDALEEVEFEMARVEHHLYSLIFGHIPGEPIVPTEFGQDARFGAPSNPSPFLGLITGVQDRFHPLQVRYLSRLGDLDLAKERLDNMHQEIQCLLGEQESLSTVGRELGADLKDILDRLPAQEADLRHEIAEIEIEVEKLRLDCVEEGIGLNRSDDGSGHSRSLYEE
ncbi:hypothetical protein BDZ45DRAFT_741133 [Acephala macrosclerotiorum]|nr:hypothetical protein BDZ45DRAFT_741133 [Acephala macrosclerotiorum]